MFGSIRLWLCQTEWGQVVSTERFSIFCSENELLVKRSFNFSTIKSRRPLLIICVLN